MSIVIYKPMWEDYLYVYNNNQFTISYQISVVLVVWCNYSSVEVESDWRLLT